MDHQQKELLINRVLSGTIRIKLGPTLYIVSRLNNEQKYEAMDFYYEMLNLSSFYELLTDAELDIYLFKNKIWNPQKQERLENLPKEIEDIKVDLYNAMVDGKARAIYRTKLDELRKELDLLYSEKHCLDYLSMSGFAESMKNKFILCTSLKLDDISESLYEQLSYILIKNRIKEEQFRELARTDPWRTIWNLGKNLSLLPYPVSDYTDEQKNLCSWSKMYDNIYESHECPHDSVIEDDDMLDGWLIKNRRKREEEAVKKQGEEMISSNPRIKNANEIFVVCETPEAAKRIESLNDNYAKGIKQQRLAVLRDKGSIKEQDLPDVRMDIMTQASQMLSNRVKGG